MAGFMTQLQTASTFPGPTRRSPVPCTRSKPELAGATAAHARLLVRTLAGLGVTDQKLADELAHSVGGIYQINGGQRLPARLLATNVHVLTEGWAFRSQMLPNGTRQITDILVPGDFCSTSLCDEEAFCAVEACGPARVAVLNMGLLTEQARTLVEQRRREQQGDVVRRLRNRLVNLGRRNARERLVYFCVETHSRLANVQVIEGSHSPGRSLKRTWPTFSGLRQSTSIAYSDGCAARTCSSLKTGRSPSLICSICVEQAGSIVLTAVASAGAIRIRQVVSEQLHWSRLR